MIRNWNEGWLFYRGDDAPVPVCLPHDAMLLEPRDAKCRNGVNSGYFPGGKYTYEKHFQVSPEDLGQFIAVRFDGVYQNCTVSVNAKRVGNHFYGFTPFEVDISQAVHVGENVIRVFVDNSLEPNCRWYTGSGIYRPVQLVTAPKARVQSVHIDTLNYDPAEVAVTVQTSHCRLRSKFTAVRHWSLPALPASSV